MGHFILKFLKELNSASSSKMITLAVVFGLIAGFLPAVNFFTMIIFIFVLIFRIPIGLFLASFSLFGFLGYLSDPVFHKIGYTLLTCNFLKPVWTFCYNLPLFRWSGFNNTVVAGSLISGIILGIVLYFLMEKTIILYKRAVFEKLKTKKYFSWLVPNEKKGIIRISGIGFAGIIAVLVILFFSFLLDPIVKYSLEFSLSKILHKKVTVEKVDVSLKNLSIDIKNMQIDKLLFKTVYTKLDWGKIVWKKYKIDNLKFTAQTDQNIYGLIKKNSENKTNSLKPLSNFHISLPNPKDLLASENLKTLNAIKKLETDYKKTEKLYKNFDIKKQKKNLADLQNRLNALKNAKIKNPEDLNKLINNINAVKKESSLILTKIKKQKDILLKNRKIIEEDIKNVKLAANEDLANIKSKYVLLKNKQYSKFAQTLLKPQISKYLHMASVIYGKIKPYISGKEQKTQKYVRKKGEYIKFKDKIYYPDFVLVNAFGKMKTSIANWQINLKNISDAQALLGKKGRVSFFGKGKFFDVGGKITYLKNVDFDIYGNNIVLNNVNFNYFNLNSFVNAKIIGYLSKDAVDAKIIGNFMKVKIEANTKIKKLLGNSLNNINNFNIITNISGNVDSPKIRINSDLDKIFSKILQNRLNEEINKKTLQARKILNEKIKSKNLNINGINLQLNELNSMENIRNLMKKEAVSIVKSKENSIKNRGINKIKSLLPF